jgi:hypothetical protein
VRDEATQRTDADVIEVAEFDLVIARLHVPETV